MATSTNLNQAFDNAMDWNSVNLARGAMKNLSSLQDELNAALAREKAINDLGQRTFNSPSMTNADNEIFEQFKSLLAQENWVGAMEMFHDKKIDLSKIDKLGISILLDDSIREKSISCKLLISEYCKLCYLEPLDQPPHLALEPDFNPPELSHLGDTPIENFLIAIKTLSPQEHDMISNFATKTIRAITDSSDSNARLSYPSITVSKSSPE